MNTHLLETIHEQLGNEYLDTMKRHGIEFPPPVAWMTNPPVPNGCTIAVIFLDDEEVEVRGYPRDMLASVVAHRAAMGCIIGSRN